MQIIAIAMAVSYIHMFCIIINNHSRDNATKKLLELDLREDRHLFTGLFLSMDSRTS